ncbi:MAG TPA: hypothetical protein VFW19_15050 [Allosphingosinicella sp.]|nr:hypothetical protein [Allosphingosinicella sp.]
MHRLVAALAAATILAVPAAAQPGAAPDPILPICDKALVAAMDGGDAKATVDQATRAMDEKQRQLVGTVCAIYLMGALAFAKHAREAARLPAGGTAI